jgi:SAM-dependent methyltransferase
VDDRLSADVALRRLQAGEALLYQGDYRNARQLLSSLERRLERPARRPSPAPDLREAFHRGRARKASLHAVLSRLLVLLDPGLRLRLRHAPDVAQACLRAWGSEDGPTVRPLREVLGAMGAEEWRRVGLEIPGLSGRIHPHYGVFTPTRGDYPALLAKAPSPRDERVLDVGTGTGVLGFLLLQAGAAAVVGTDLEPRAVACANENAQALGFADRFRAVEADLFPEGTADLVVCNPPWIPARPRTPLDRAIYDPDSRFLSRFLAELPGHLAPGGEGWLILSDLPERLGLRPAGAVDAAIASAGLEVVEKLEVAPTHPSAQDPEDPLQAARAEERTGLWRLVAN